jgi:hypothetical protein
MPAPPRQHAGTASQLIPGVLRTLGGRGAKTLFRAGVVVLWAATTQAGGSGPVASLPAGWTYIPSFGRDTRIGAFHDRQSGAFARYWVSSEEPGTLGCAETRVLETAVSLPARLAAWRAASAKQCLPPEGTDAAPEGASLVVIRESVTGRNPLWLQAVTCSQEQERRVIDLARRLDPRARGRGTPESSPVSRAWVSSLKPGTPMGAVLRSAGTQSLVRGLGCEGLRLVYHVEGYQSEATLAFSKDETLQSAVVEP